MPAVRVLSGRLHRASPSAAGFDLITTEAVCIWPQKRVTVPTGVRTSMDPGVVGLIRDRSGLADRSGLIVLAGVIDADYEGEWKVVLLNTGDDMITLEAGTRCAQVLFIPVTHDVGVAEDGVVSLGADIRSDRGFGSSGR